MTRAQFALRISACIAIIGISIILATLTVQNYSDILGVPDFTLGPNETFATLIAPLNDGPHEIRITAPRSFNATLYIFNYEGTRKLLTDGTKEPLIKENIRGSTLIDFNLTRRGPYLIMLESHTSTEASGTVGIVEKAISNQDMIWDSTIIIIVGFAVAMIAVLSKIKRSQPTARIGS